MPFEKGKSGNPSGRRRLPDDIVDAKKMNKLELERILNQLIWMSMPELITHLKDPSVTAFEKLAGSIIVKGIQTGDPSRCEFLLCRLIGKVKEDIEVSLPKPTVIEYKGNRLVLATSQGEE